MFRGSHDVVDVGPTLTRGNSKADSITFEDSVIIEKICGSSCTVPEKIAYFIAIFHSSHKLRICSHVSESWTLDHSFDMVRPVPDPFLSVR